MTGFDWAFRSQLVLPEHRDLFDYWSKLRRGRQWPARGDISPASFRRHLRFVSLIDVEYRPVRFRVRLAGTGLRDVYGQEITGAYLDELPFIDEHSFERFLDRSRAAQGVMPCRAGQSSDLIQFWLRLPLSDGQELVEMLLCHDAFLQAPKAQAIVQRISAGRSVGAA